MTFLNVNLSELDTYLSEQHTPDDVDNKINQILNEALKLATTDIGNDDT